MSLDQSGGGEDVVDLGQRRPQFLDAVEAAHLSEVLLQHADEAFEKALPRPCNDPRHARVCRPGDGGSPPATPSSALVQSVPDDRAALSAPTCGADQRQRGRLARSGTAWSVLAAAGQARAAHGLDFRRAKGRPAFRAATLVAKSSRSRSISPRQVLRRSLSSSSPSAGREASLAWPTARKASRQLRNVAAVTPSECETVCGPPRRAAAASHPTSPCLTVVRDGQMFGEKGQGQ